MKLDITLVIILYLWAALIVFFSFDSRADLNKATSIDIGLGSLHSNEGWWQKKLYQTTYVSPTTGRTYDAYKLVRTDHKWKELNPAVGFRKGITDNLEIGGGFVAQSSYGTSGLYGGFELHTDRNKPVSVGIAGGVTDVYKNTLSEKNMPLNGLGYLAPTIQFTKQLKKSAHSLRANVLGVGGDVYAVWFQYSYARM